MSVYDEMYDCIESARSTDACEYHVYSEMFDLIAEAEAESEKLKALVRDMWHDGMCECDERGACTECEYGYLERMRDLGVEVDE